MRYTVMIHDTKYKSIPDRPGQDFSLKFLAQVSAAICNKIAQVDGDHAEYYVQDNKKQVRVS